MLRAVIVWGVIAWSSVVSADDGELVATMTDELGLNTSNYFLYVHRVTPSKVDKVIAHKLSYPGEMGWSDAKTLWVRDGGPEAVSILKFVDGKLADTVRVPKSAWKTVSDPDPEMVFGTAGEVWLQHCTKRKTDETEACIQWVSMRVDTKPFALATARPKLDARRVSRSHAITSYIDPSQLSKFPKAGAPAGYSVAFKKVPVANGAKHDGLVCTGPNNASLVWPGPDLEDAMFAMKPKQTTWLRTSPPIVRVDGKAKNPVGQTEHHSLFIHGCSKLIDDAEYFDGGLWAYLVQTPDDEVNKQKLASDGTWTIHLDDRALGTLPGRRIRAAPRPSAVAGTELETAERDRLVQLATTLIDSNPRAAGVKPPRVLLTSVASSIDPGVGEGSPFSTGISLQKPVVAGSSDGKAGWIAADVAEGSAKAAFHATVIFDRDGAAQPLAIQIGRLFTTKEQAAAIAAGAKPPAIPRRVAGAEDVVAIFEGSIGDSKRFAATVSDRSDVVLFGSELSERIVGGKAVRTTLERWGFALKVRDGIQAGTTSSKTVAWLAANVDASKGGTSQPYRALAIYEKSGGTWKMVHLHFSFVDARSGGAVATKSSDKLDYRFDYGCKDHAGGKLPSKSEPRLEDPITCWMEPSNDDGLYLGGTIEISKDASFGGMFEAERRRITATFDPQKSHFEPCTAFTVTFTAGTPAYGKTVWTKKLKIDQDCPD